ncbi:hypothetical protein MTO96_045896, partial [Rhipicephalus appendiculatus]
RYGYGGWIEIKHESDKTAVLSYDDGRFFRRIESNGWSVEDRIADMDRTGILQWTMNANPSVSFVVELTSLVHRCENNDTKPRLLNPRYSPSPLMLLHPGHPAFIDRKTVAHSGVAARARDGDQTRLPKNLTSQPGQRAPIPPAISKPPFTVSWAQVASSNFSSSQNISLEKVLAENASLKAEIEKLKLELHSRMPLSTLSQHSEPRSSVPADSPPTIETMVAPPPPMDTTPPMSRDTSLPPSNKRKSPATPRQEESLGDSVLTLNDRINALENKTQNRFAVIESKISDIESRFTALENGQAAINGKLDKFLDFVQAHMQQTAAWIAAVTANNPNIAVPAPSPTPPS